MNFTKNQLVTLEITDVSHDGEGIGKVDGFAFFVKDTIPGDQVTAKVMKTKKTYGYARLEEILVPSADRVEPVCPHDKACGGCQLQAMSYERQLAFKQQKVYNNLLRIGGIEEDLLQQTMEPVVGMEEPFHYRNKAQYPVGKDKNGQVITGFYAGRTHSIIANTQCYLGVKENQDILERILQYMREHHVSPYDETEGSGLVRHILIRTGFTSGQIMVCMIVNMTKEVWEKKGAARLHTDALVEALKEVPGMTGISLNFNTRRDNVIMGNDVVTLWGNPYIEDSLYVRHVSADCEESEDARVNEFERTGEKLDFHISPLSFYQVNPGQTEKLYSIALDYAGLTGKETVWDLYCGIGTISLFLSRRAGQVYGVEIIPQAIEDAKANAKRNGITNAEFFVGKAEEVLPEFYERMTGSEAAGEKVDMLHPDVIVVDPPRKGCDTACLDTMLKMKPERIVYVSCDSATLARDVKYLREGGYELKKWRAVDQFGMTVHVETVVLLSHTKPDSHINIKVEFGEDEGQVFLEKISERAEARKPKERVTYQMIKDYIEEKYGFKVHTAYIAEVKRELGFPMHDAPNAVEDLKQSRKHPTAEKVEAIKDALRYFEMV